MKKSLFRAKRAPIKARPKKPLTPAVVSNNIDMATPIEPVNAPLYPSVEDLYPHLEIERPGPARPMPPITKWR